MSPIRHFVIGPLLASLFVGGIAMAGTKHKEPPTGYTYQTVAVGNHHERRLVRVNHNPGSYVIARTTGSPIAEPGDYWAYQTVGRHQVRVWVHDVVVDPAGAVSSDVCTGCSHRSINVGKHTEWRDFCVVGGRSVDCSRNPPECPECAAMSPHRMDWCEDQVIP